MHIYISMHANTHFLSRKESEKKEGLAEEKESTLLTCDKSQSCHARD